MMSNKAQDNIRAILWVEDCVRLLDQRKLPHEVTYLDCKTIDAVIAAIADMVVRGAPAIGITAAYGVVLAVKQRFQEAPRSWKNAVREDLMRLIAARPTAVNLRWAVEHMRTLMESLDNEPVVALLQEARRIHEQDITANRRMGELGAELLEKRSTVLTHCNAGALATGGYGTALGVIRSGYVNAKVDAVYADETRPWLQGSRLTAWELVQDGIPVTLICDSAAATLMKQQRVNWVVVGADRIAANGDVANKIGTYNLAVNARHHGVKFMVVAPTTTIDMETATGEAIEIENRDPEEILSLQEQRIGAESTNAWNPVFDVTPARFIDALVTEKGVVKSPDTKKIAKLMRS